MTRVVTLGPGTEHLGPAVAAMGVFDGVHIGHQALVQAAIQQARQRDVAPVVLTFDRDPDRVVRPENAAPQLLELEDKLEFLCALEPEVVLVVPFDAPIAAMSPEVFFERVVLSTFDPVAFVVGHDFRFGHKAAGDVDTLSALGALHGFAVTAHPLVTADGAPITSTRIRALLAHGRVEDAALLLGRPHRVRGCVVHGRGRGVVLGVPTANVRPHSYAAVPADGVYSARATVGGKTYDAAVSAGAPPSFPGSQDVVEVHLLGFDGGELHGEEIAVDFVARIRDLRAFDSTRDLVAAIRHDIEAARSTLRAAGTAET
ncbi:MAG: riboflavin biosynthesis protein RibF [Actinomycetia bacterium]|nr:riboflavin biosynthesis protein RibF [Actinomycetes bacterium]